MIQPAHRVQTELKTQFKTQLGREARRKSPGSWGIAVLLLLLIFWLFIQLWVGNGTIPDIFFLNQDIKAQKLLNQSLQKENEQRIEQIKSLKGGDEELEARARLELGMLKPGEIFYEIPSGSSSGSSSESAVPVAQNNHPDNAANQTRSQSKPSPISGSVEV
jgi:cell division protein FtsB